MKYPNSGLGAFLDISEGSIKVYRLKIVGAHFTSAPFPEMEKNHSPRYGVVSEYS